MGTAPAASIGLSDEFIGIREYRQGDPLRHFHWKSCARLNRPMVKEFEDEFFPRYALALDTFAAPNTLAHFEEAVSIAASFACTVDTKEAMLDLLFVGASAYCFTTGHGRAQPQRLLEILAAVEACRGEDIPVWALETTSSSRPYTEVEYPRPVALVLGNEALGVGREVIEAADELIEIPVFGFKNSLNVASACAVVLFEILRQWGAVANGDDPQRPALTQ